MSGLNLGFGGSGQAGVKARAQANYAPGAGPSSMSGGAFGQGTTVAPSTGEVVKPNDPVGAALWASVGGLAFLVFTRHSLPTNMKRLFDLILMEIIAAHLATGVVRMEARRVAAAGGPIGQVVGGATNIVLGS